jgi:hypothetical protein
VHRLPTPYGSGAGIGFVKRISRVLIERIWKDPKTTVLGLLIVGLCFVLVFYEKATLTEVSAFMMGAFALLFLKDPKDGKAADGK